MKNLNKLKFRQANKLYSLLGIVLIIVLFLIAYRKLWSGGMFAYNDCLPFSGSAQEAFRAFLSAWDNRSPGINFPLRHSSFVTLIKGVLTFIFSGNSVFAERVFLFLPMPLSFLSMYIFLSYFVKSRFAKYISAFIYSVAPMAVGELQGGWVQNIYVQAIFPILVICLVKMARSNKRILNLFLFSLLLAIGFMLSDHIVLFVTPVILFWIFFDFENKTFNFEKDQLRIKILSILFAAVIIFFLTNFHTVFFLKSAFPFLGGRKLVRTEVLDVLTNDVLYCYSSSTPKVILSLGRPEVKSLSKQIINFIPFVLCLFSLFFIRNKEKSKHILIFSLGALFVVLFVWLTHKRETIRLFQLFPVLFRFRNHARPLLLLSFFYAPLIALGLDGLEKNLTNYFKENRTRVIIISFFYLIIIGGVATYNNTFWLGDFQLLQRDGSIITPDSYYEVTSWLNKKRAEKDFFRTLWLPWELNEEEVHLVWLDPYTFSAIIGYGLYAQSPFADYIEFFFHFLANEKESRIGDLLAVANVRYIVVNLASRQRGPIQKACVYYTPYIFGDPQSFVDFFNKQEGLKLVVTDEKYLIYENKRFVSHISAYRNISFIPFLPRQCRNPLKTFASLLDVHGFDVEKQLLIFNSQLSSQQLKLFSDNLGVLKKDSIPSPKYSLCDEFNGDNLDELKWLTDGPVNLDGGVLNIPLRTGIMNYLESMRCFDPGVSVEVRARLGTTDRSCNINLIHDIYNSARFNFFRGGPALSLITYNSGQYTETKVGGWDSNYHVYKITWQSDQVEYYIDDILKAVHRTNVPTREMRIRFDGEGGQTFNIDYIKAEQLYHDPITTLSTQLDEKIKIYSEKVTETEYRVETESEGPLFLVLGDAYHPSWAAYVNGKRLEHFPAFYWANGFYLDKKGKSTVRIIYSEQRLKNITLFISGFSWFLLLIGIIYYVRKPEVAR